MITIAYLVDISQTVAIVSFTGVLPSTPIEDIATSISVLNNSVTMVTGADQGTHLSIVLTDASISCSFNIQSDEETISTGIWID